MIRRRSPRRSLGAVDYATLEWVDWYNTRRLLEPIGNVPPAEVEARHYAQPKPAVMAACLKPTSLQRTQDSSAQEIATVCLLRSSMIVKAVPSRHQLYDPHHQ